MDVARGGVRAGQVIDSCGGRSCVSVGSSEAMLTALCHVCPELIGVHHSYFQQFDQSQPISQFIGVIDSRNYWAAVRLLIQICWPVLVLPEFVQWKSTFNVGPVMMQVFPGNQVFLISSSQSPV